MVAEGYTWAIEEAEKGCGEYGIDYSTEGVVIDGKGHVDILRAPPEGMREAARGSSAEKEKSNDRDDGSGDPGVGGRRV